MTTTSVVRLHPDRIITPRDYTDLPPHTLLVRSEFLTLQGEGPYAGWPSYFIRTAGCNYGDKVRHCGGSGLSCDTDFRFDLGNQRSVPALAAAAQDARVDIVVLTGGEPLMQSTAALELIQLLRSNDISTQIESNGVYATEAFARSLDEYDGTLVISPKADETTGYNMPLLKKLTQLLVNNDNVYLKFLIGNYPYDSVPIDIEDYGHHVFLSPITVYASSYDGEIANSWDPKLVDQQQTAANHARAAQLALQHRCRFSMQQHNFCSLP